MNIEATRSRNDLLVVGRTSVFRPKKIEDFTPYLNRPYLQKLDKDDFIIFPSVKKTREMRSIESEFGNGSTLPEILYDLYYEKKNSSWDVSWQLGIGQNTVVCWMEKYGMRLRPNEESKISSK